MLRLTAILLSLATSDPDLNELALQLEHRSCAYSTQTFEVCQLRPLRDRLIDFAFGWLIGSHQQYECPLGAARCLEKLGPKAAPAAPALLKVLQEGPNDFDTGDGVIAVRSEVVAALAATRDPRAVEALASALEQRPAESERAILEALGSFGPQAAVHWKLAADRLRARNLDKGFDARMREQFDWSIAVELAQKEVQNRNPGVTSYVIPNEAVAAARKLIDRNAPGYIKALESRSEDLVAAAAARALGKMRRADAVDVLVETLTNFHAARAAAQALGEIGNRSPAVVSGLQQALASARLGPGARSECARALGRLKATQSIPQLRGLLASSELAAAAAAALGDIGPPAGAALPELKMLATLPTLAVRNGNSLHFSAEASSRGDAKRAAVRAILAIEPERAAAFLAPLRGDPDTGGVIRRALSRPAP